MAKAATYLRNFVEANRSGNWPRPLPLGWVVEENRDQPLWLQIPKPLGDEWKKYAPGPATSIRVTAVPVTQTKKRGVDDAAKPERKRRLRTKARIQSSRRRRVRPPNYKNKTHVKSTTLLPHKLATLKRYYFIGCAKTNKKQQRKTKKQTTYNEYGIIQRSNLILKFNF
jgi:hypothetical protein